MAQYLIVLFYNQIMVKDKIIKTQPFKIKEFNNYHFLQFALLLINLKKKYFYAIRLQYLNLQIYMQNVIDWIIL